MAYTLAFIDDMILAVVPDGKDVDAEVHRVWKLNGGEQDGPCPENYDTEKGLLLTNEAPEHEALFWDASTGTGGWLIDEKGQGWKYAVHNWKDFS